MYFQSIPIDPITDLSAIPYKSAEEIGCFKIDFLHLNVYSHFTSRSDIVELLKIEPDWNLLTIPSVVNQLFQISKHYELITKVTPRSILSLADCLALIRPQKRFLLDKYVTDPTRWRSELYKLDGDDYAFKKSHAISYALVIILQLHLISGGINL